MNEVKVTPKKVILCPGSHPPHPPQCPPLYCEQHCQTQIIKRICEQDCSICQDRARAKYNRNKITGGDCPRSITITEMVSHQPAPRNNHRLENWGASTHFCGCCHNREEDCGDALICDRITAQRGGILAVTIRGHNDVTNSEHGHTGRR